ncbi:TetR/AcrR family transcriptional regulator [Corynebacterium epidermidicanis]|uniref:Transcriptional regulator, TetR family n=1 Tax=Corynebacterium epidermidicanis TaxID=1050174 RepID=A0A0G3GSZ3_9CORY|nr:TetR/AcrR family transcriptional regulator [Corynebacterium epidermidicanis]AKK02638.1 transcriptional regulator, TetR family [Corynebacterium epidermidicanis]
MLIEHVHSTGRAQQKEQTSEKILSTAFQLFNSQGFETTTIREIASQAGVSVGRVMKLGDKNSILIQVIHKQIEVIHDEIRASSTELIEVLKPFLLLFGKNPSLSQAYACALISQDRNANDLNRIKALLIDEITARLSDNLTLDQKSEFASLFYHGYLGILLGWITGLHDIDELERQSSSLINTLEKAFLPK